MPKQEQVELMGMYISKSMNRVALLERVGNEINFELMQRNLRERDVDEEENYHGYLKDYSTQSLLLIEAGVLKERQDLYFNIGQNVFDLAYEGNSIVNLSLESQYVIPIDKEKILELVKEFFTGNSDIGDNDGV